MLWDILPEVGEVIKKIISGEVRWLRLLRSKVLVGVCQPHKPVDASASGVTADPPEQDAALFPITAEESGNNQMVMIIRMTSIII